MKRAPRSRQRHDLYAKYHDYDSEISDLLGECGLKAFAPDDYQVSNTRFQAGTPPIWGRAAGFPAYSRQHSFGNGAMSLPSVLLVGGVSDHFGKFF